MKEVSKDENSGLFDYFQKKRRDEPMLEIGKNENALIERNIFISEPLTFWQRVKYLLFNDSIWKNPLIHRYAVVIKLKNFIYSWRRLCL